jgi:hypothetical protein
VYDYISVIKLQLLKNLNKKNWFKQKKLIIKLWNVILYIPYPTSATLHGICKKNQFQANGEVLNWTRRHLTLFQCSKRQGEQKYLYEVVSLE